MSFYLFAKLVNRVNFYIHFNYYIHKAKKMKRKADKDTLLEASGNKSTKCRK